MKICIISHTFPRYKEDAKSAAFMHPLALGLKEEGNQVTVLVPYNSLLKPEDFPYKVVQFKYIWPLSLHVLGYSRTLREGMRFEKKLYFLSPLFFLFGIIALCKLSRKEKFDVVSSHWILPSGFMAYVASKFTKIPYTIALAGSDVFIAKKNLLFRVMALLAASSSAAVLADSPKFLEDLVSLGAEVKKSDIIPYPVNVEKFKPNQKENEILRQELGLKNNAFVVLGVGRLIYKKGFRYLIEAFAGIAKKHKEAHLVIGGDGDLKNELETLASDLGIKSKVTFAGNIERDKISAYYNMCDVFVMPSISDAQGNIDDQPVALIEAMACGKPIVASNFPGISLTVVDGSSGFLTPQKDSKSIEEALIKLASSGSLRRKMGVESRKIVLNKLSVKKISERYMNIFNKI